MCQSTETGQLNWSTDYQVAEKRCEVCGKRFSAKKKYKNDLNVSVCVCVWCYVVLFSHRDLQRCLHQSEQNIQTDRDDIFRAHYHSQCYVRKSQLIHNNANPTTSQMNCQLLKTNGSEVRWFCTFIFTVLIHFCSSIQRWLFCQVWDNSAFFRATMRVTDATHSSSECQTPQVATTYRVF